MVLSWGKYPDLAEAFSPCILTCKLSCFYLELHLSSEFNLGRTKWLWPTVGHFGVNYVCSNS